MKYNFDEIIERRGTNSYKWDLVKEDGVIPMWVADMDFQTAPCIIEALQKRVAHGIFGYTLVPDSYYEAIINWFSRRHQWKIEKDWILYTSGVVPAISCSLKAICMPGEKVLVQTPVYNCFFSCITNSGCEVVENELKRVGNCTYESISRISSASVPMRRPPPSFSATLTTQPEEYGRKRNWSE